MAVCVWVHLGADDSLGGSLYVGRQTKECRSVILWEILYYAAVLLERHTHTCRSHTKKLKRENVSMLPIVIMALRRQDSSIPKQYSTCLCSICLYGVIQ